MGMFDNIQYKDKWYQTKDTPNQALDNFKIEADQESGHEYLWEEKYEAEYVKDAESMFGGHIKRDNLRWEKCEKFDGLICFYRHENKVWHEYKALFMNGKLIKIEHEIDNAETEGL